MDTSHKKGEGTLRRIKEKLKNFFQKTLYNKNDASIGRNLKDDAYRNTHDNLKMY